MQAKIRRGVRVVEGARLESVCRGNLTGGSNPSLSASPAFAISYSDTGTGFRPFATVLLPFHGKKSFLHLFNDRRRYGFVQAVHRVFVPRREPFAVGVNSH